MQSLTRAALLLVFLLISSACGSGDNSQVDEALPTRFILPTLSTEPTQTSVIPSAIDEQSTDRPPTIAFTHTPSPSLTSEEFLLDEENTPASEEMPGLETTNEADMLPPGTTLVPTPESTESPPMMADMGITVNQDFSELQIGDIVLLEGLVIEDPFTEQYFLQDRAGNQIYLAGDRAVLDNVAGTRITISGEIIGLDGDDLLTLNPQSMPETIFLEAEATSEVDPMAEMLDEGQYVFDETVASDLTALEAYDTLLPLIESELDGHLPTLIYGNPLAGWTIEFYREVDESTLRFIVTPEGEVFVDTLARVNAVPGQTLASLEREQIQVDSKDIYAQLNLSEEAAFAIPDLRLYMAASGSPTWEAATNPAQIFDATQQP